MPRPTVAQLSYGSATVICSTLAMLLLSQATSPPGIAVIALAALGLGLLVALTVPLPKPARGGATAAAPAAHQVPARRTVIAPGPARDRAATASASVREPAGP
ncbi:hypothetical protein [Streptomyces spectabilis]|uniref:Uncharacterized protein n=1 Tax=Streptomyces spectabilis TaxID=68270 RepID=A0A5P2X5H5_STRST|nr:hypothetical protein [Streptomyces spectabilis]MBB5106394.1 hypothetical protein [Streptomyces spectabilis]MCI3903003.1 hypothetical protein [Streptomyces spectabilis]QEV60263.1 hypothetical protein CP982_17285 [Streptomyces spectabilis]